MKSNLLHKPVPRTDGVPLITIIRLFFNGLRDGALSMRAASISFNFFLAIFPTILFFFSIIPYIPVKDFDVLLMDSLKNFMPMHAYETIKVTVEDIVSRPRGGILSIGFLMTLYFATNGINSIIEGFNQTSHDIETRSWVKQRLISILLLLIISVLLITSITLISFNSFLMQWFMKIGLIKSSFSYFMMVSGKFFILGALVYFVHSFIYYLGPAKKQSFKFFSYGSTVATILVILSSFGFNYYINNFSTYNALYGSIGTLIIVLVWINLYAHVVLIGFEINVSILRSRSQKNIDKAIEFLKD